MLTTSRPTASSAVQGGSLLLSHSSRDLCRTLNNGPGCSLNIAGGCHPTGNTDSHHCAAVVVGCPNPGPRWHRGEAEVKQAVLC